MGGEGVGLGGTPSAPSLQAWPLGSHATGEVGTLAGPASGAIGTTWDGLPFCSSLFLASSLALPLSLGSCQQPS